VKSMPAAKVICIITNAHGTNDMRLYHKLGKSLAKIARVYILGAKGFGSLTENWQEEKEYGEASNPEAKPIRLIVSGLNPYLRLFGLYRQTLKLHPDLVICVEPLTMFVGLLLKRKIGCKLIYDAHEYYASAHGEKYGFPLNQIVSGIYSLAEHFLQEKMDFTLAVNEDIFRRFNLKVPESIKSDDIISIQPSKKKSALRAHYGIVCPNYPTVDIFKDDLDGCNVGKLLPDTQFDTIYLGGLTEERGILKLLQVVDILRLKYPMFKALFVGPFRSEAFKQKFFAFLLDHNLNSNVFWREAVPPDKVCPILRQVKVGLSVLHPACKRYNKAVPLKVLEYLAVGIPVVANDFPQLKEIIARNHLGYCVPFHKQDIANAIDKLLQMPEAERKELAERSHKLIREQYLWTRVEPILLSAVNYTMNS